MNGSVAYILMGFPRVSETFIASEIHRVEQAGVPLRLYVIKPVEEREQGHRHPVLDAIEAQPEYLPDPTVMTQAAARVAAAATCASSCPPLRRCLRRPPARRRCARSGPSLGQIVRDRRDLLAAPRKIYIKELLQAFALADRLLDAPDVRHLHAHFAHGTTTVTWLAARITGLPFSLHRPRARHLQLEAQPQGLAAAQAAAPRASSSPAPRPTSAT